MIGTRERRWPRLSASAAPRTGTSPSRTTRHGGSGGRRPPGRRGVSPRGQVQGDRAQPSEVPVSATADAPTDIPARTAGEDNPTNPAANAYADVMVVDDDDDVRSSMAAVIRGDGMSVVEAGDGQAALDALRTIRVGVLLLDLHMTPRDGVWLLEQLRDPPAVIMVSAFALYGESDMRRRFAHIVANFVQKPVPPPKLIELVRARLDAGPA